MTTQQANAIPMEDLILKINRGTQFKEKGKELCCISPFRSEKTPSFYINSTKNTWYDFGMGQGGSVIDFLQIYINKADVSECLKFLERQVGSLSFSGEKNAIEKPIKEENPKIKLIKIKELGNAALKNYLIHERCISPKIALKYCKEVYYQIGNKRYFSIGLKNHSQGYELRNKYFKNCIGKKNVTYIDNKSSCLYVTEGMTDFLSIKQGNLEDGTINNHLILNSTALYNKAKPFLAQNKVLFLFLDSDESGKALTQKIIQDFPDKKIIDASYLYGDKNFKDLNEWLKDKMLNAEVKKACNCSST